MTPVASFIIGIVVGGAIAGAFILAAKDRLNTALSALESAANSAAAAAKAAAVAAQNAGAPVGDQGGLTEDETNAAAARIEAATSVLNGDTPTPAATSGVIPDPSV